jgi:hypothetical protein
MLFTDIIKIKFVVIIIIIIIICMVYHFYAWYLTNYMLETMRVVYIVLQLRCSYNLWYM